MLDMQVEAGPATHPARPRRAHTEVEHGVVVLGVIGLGPHLTDRSEAKRLGAVLHDDCNGLHGTSIPDRWQ